MTVICESQYSHGSAILLQQSSSEAKFSFVDDVEFDMGGSSLKFESKLDDHTVVDLQFMRRLVLRTMELLYYEKKWERLIDIGLRFTSLTEYVLVFWSIPRLDCLDFNCISYIHVSSDRYVEQVYPLIILAQRLLADRIIQEGEVVPQLHFVNAMEEYKEITPSIYAMDLQLLIPEVMVNGERKLLVHSSDYRAERDPLAAAVLKGRLHVITTPRITEIPLIHKQLHCLSLLSLC